MIERDGHYINIYTPLTDMDDNSSGYFRILIPKEKREEILRKINSLVTHDCLTRAKCKYRYKNGNFLKNNILYVYASDYRKNIALEELRMVLDIYNISISKLKWKYILIITPRAIANKLPDDIFLEKYQKRVSELMKQIT